MINKDKLIEIYNQSILIKVVLFIVINVILLPFFLIFLIIAPIIKVRFIRLVDERIGHLAGNTEVFLRRLNIGIIDKRRTIFIGIASDEPANKQLVMMIKRKMKVVTLPSKIYKSLIFRVLSSKKSFLGYFGIYQEIEMDSNEYFEFNNAEPVLSFSQKEEKEGRELLQKMGMHKKDWFICFHARDPAYLKNKFKGASSYLNYRDSDIKNTLKAVEYITSKGGYALRMGADITARLPHLANPKIIDYAREYRSDFGDIYLPAKCKFFLANTAGIMMVSSIFNVPVACANYIQLQYTPFRECDLFIPKKLWSKKKKKFLTFREIIKFEDDIYLKIKRRYLHDEDYWKAGLKVIENTPEEILDLVKEMNQRLDGTWKMKEGDAELQKEFKSLFKKDSPCYGFPSMIGTEFLRKNKELLK